LALLPIDAVLCMEISYELTHRLYV
jgi:hypothetical protein